MGILSRGLENTKRLWGTLGGPQKLVLGLAAVVLAALLMWGSAAGGSDGWQRVVGLEVDNAERAEVLKNLTQKNVAHDIRGGEIWVRKAEADRVVMELAGDGALSSQAMWKWLQDADVFATKWDKEKRFQIALQRKLEYMIRKVDGVRNASVQITQASEAHQIGFQGPTASASVQVELKPNAALSKLNVAAIVGLVAHAVPGLDRDRVHLADTQGRAYRMPRTDGAYGNGDVEADLEERVKEKITGLYPSARVAIRAVARAKSERGSRVTFGPKSVPLTEKERSVVKESGGSGGVAPIKGEQDLVPDKVAAPRVREVEKESEVTNGVDQTKLDWTDPAGQIDRITVAVILPVVVDAEGKAVGKAPDLESVRKMAANAAAAKLEDVTVVALETRAPEPIAAVATSEQAVEWLAANWTRIVLAVLGLVALLVVIRAIRSAMPKGEVEEIRAITARMGESLDAGRATITVSPQGDIADIRQNIKEVVNRHPNEAASALKSWVAGK
jgi:flagellar M-ring protein FliF